MAVPTFTLTGNLTTYANLEKTGGYGSLIIRAIPDSMPVPAELETLVQPDPFPIASDGTFSIELDAIAGVRYRVSTSPRTLFPSFAFDALAAGETVDLSEVQPVVAASPLTPYVRGASAYEVAVANGFVGTEAEWLATLGGGMGGGGRVVIETSGTYPARPSGSEPVLFIGETNPEGLGLMLVGDVWINSADTSGGGGGLSVTDNGDGTLTASTSTVTDNGDGTLAA